MLDNKEIEYIIRLLNSKMGIESRDPLIEFSEMDKTEMYFLKKKLEALKIN